MPLFGRKDKDMLGNEMSNQEVEMVEAEAAAADMGLALDASPTNLAVLQGDDLAPASSNGRQPQSEILGAERLIWHSEHGSPQLTTILIEGSKERHKYLLQTRAPREFVNVEMAIEATVSRMLHGRIDIHGVLETYHWGITGADGKARQEAIQVAGSIARAMMMRARGMMGNVNRRYGNM